MSDPMPRRAGEPCNWHKKERLHYSQKHAAFRKHMKKGHYQSQCGECGHWFFPEEFGSVPDHEDTMLIRQAGTTLKSDPSPTK